MTNNETNSALQEKLKSIFTKNLAIKIISLFFAMLIWGYVMMDQNPTRVKTINDITVSFEGEADMISRKLIVRGNREELLAGVVAKVSTQLTNYADLAADDLQATISLRSITSPGSYDLPIYATCTDGDVQSISPGTITLEVDDLVTKRIPIEYKTVNAAPEGYWAGDPVLSRSEVDIQGAKQDISKVVKGICFINMSARTQSYNEAMSITLMDAQGNALDTSALYGQLATVSVQQTIMRRKTLSVNAEDALLGADNLASNFEIAEMRITPKTVDVAGTAEALDALTEISVENIDIAGRNESLLAAVPLIIPEDVTLLTESDMVSVYIDIREIEAKADFAQMTIKTVGAKRNTTVRIDTEAIDVSVSGRTSLIKQLDRPDIVLYVDVTDLANGTYNLPVQLEFPTDTMQNELEYSLGRSNVNVTISPK